MKLLQLIYTSCKKGLTGGGGFQTYAMSDGITDKERLEIEDFSLYVPPTNLPSQPGKNEIEKLFPVALRFFKLKSGRFGVCRSQYAGQDHTGRFGNYFSHALLLEEGMFPGYPVQVCAAAPFRTALTHDEQNLEITPPALPPLILQENDISAALTFAGVAEFIAQEKRNLLLKPLITSLVNFNQDHRNIILCDKHENIFLWVAAIQMAFTPRLAHHLTFTTYVHDPTAMNCMIYSLPREGSRFAFSETQRFNDYYIFDFQDPQLPEVKNQYLFYRNINVGFGLEPGMLQEFHTFLDLFHFNVIDPQLDDADRLYRFLELAEKISSPDILAAVTFANRYASPDVQYMLSNKIAGMLVTLSQYVDYDTIETVTTFLLKIAHRSNEPKYLDTAYHFFFISFDYLILQSPPPTLQQVTELLAVLFKNNPGEDTLFPMRILNPQRLLQMEQLLHSHPGPIYAQIYLQQLLTALLISVQPGWEQLIKTIPVFTELIKTAFLLILSEPSQLEPLLLIVEKNRALFVQLFAFLWDCVAVNCEHRDLLFSIFQKVLTRQDYQWAVLTRLDLVQAGQGEFVQREYLTLLDTAENKKEFFAAYVADHFEKDNYYLMHFFSEAVRSYLTYFKGKERVHECLYLLGKERAITSDDVLRKMVEIVEGSLTLGNPVKEDWEKAGWLLKIKKSRRITTNPDVSTLIRLGIEFQKAAAGKTNCNISILMKDYSVSLEPVDSKRVAQYFQWCLPNLLYLIKGPDEHNIIFKWFWNSKLDRTFVSLYAAVFEDLLKGNKEQGIASFVSFAKFYLTTISGDNVYPAAKAKIRDQIIIILAKCSTKLFTYITQKVGMSIDPGEEAFVKEWREIVDCAGANRKDSLFTRITHIFVRSKEKKKEKMKIT